MLQLLLAASLAYGGVFCHDAVTSFAADRCVTPLTLFEVDMGTGPIVWYSCTVDPDLGDETVAAWSLSTDFADFANEQAVDCVGGDLWIDPMSDEPFNFGMNGASVAWSLYHEFDDDKEERTLLDEWLLKESILNTFVRLDFDHEQ